MTAFSNKGNFENYEIRLNQIEMNILRQALRINKTFCIDNGLFATAEVIRDMEKKIENIVEQ